MNNLQKIGGYAALVEAATYLVGIGVLLFILMPAGFAAEESDPAQSIAFLIENQTFMHLWHLLIYIVNGIFLVILVQALYERLKVDAPALAQTAAAFGLIWAGLVIASGMVIINDLGVVTDLFSQDPTQASTVWLALTAVEDGLGGGIELPGGLWLLLVSWAGLRSGLLPKMLNTLGTGIGLAGILTVLPGLNLLGPLFGLGSIIWFAWTGFFLLRSSASPEVDQPGVLKLQQEGAR